jgi:hypothetical protein
MALLSDAVQKRINTYVVSPGRSSAVANTSNDLGSAVERIDVNLDGATVNINHSANTYVLTKPPSSVLIPNPRIGDKVRVFIVDDARTDNPCAYAEFVYTRTVTAAGVVSGNPSWRMVTSA